MADPSHIDDDPIAIAHRLIDCLTTTKLRVNLVQRHLREGSIASATIEKTLTQLEHELDEAAELAQVLRTTLARSEEDRDSSEARAGETDPGGR